MSNRTLLASLLVLALATAGCNSLTDSLNPGQSGPGSKYEAYLTGSETLVIELDHAPGAKPDQRAIDDMRRELRKTGKTIDIRTSADLPSKGSGYAWSEQELHDLHAEHQDEADSGSQVVMHALYVDGKFGGQQDVAGLAYATEAFAIFMGEIREKTCSNDATLCPQGVRQWKVVRAVSIHEAGHLLGLVNSPLPMVNDHEDPEHPAHSTNSNSVMFWKVENAQGLESLITGGDVPWEFDQNDKRDMDAVRQGG